jgi:hypothetical protein
VFCIVFSFKNKFFLRETREWFEGVQRRGPVKGAACPRSSQTLDREHRWKTPALKGRGLSGKKMEKKSLRPRTPNGKGYLFRLREGGSAGAHTTLLARQSFGGRS